MSEGTRRIARLAAIIVCLGAVFAGTVAGTGHATATAGDATAEDALGETELTKEAVELADQQVVIGVGGLLVGLSIGMIVAGAITYRRKREQIRRQLE